MAVQKMQGFEESLLEVRKVTKVTTGGRKMRFRATILVGDKGGHIGLGVGKGNDVAVAVAKATHDAYKHIRQVPITTSGSIPYRVTSKYKSCRVALIPAAPGTGLKAGSSVRIVLELAGYANILSKIIGSNNRLNNAINTIMMLTSFKVDSSKMQATRDIVLEEVTKEKNGKDMRKPSPKKTSDKVAPSVKVEKNDEEKKPVAKKAVEKKTTEEKKVAAPKALKKEETVAKEEVKKATPKAAKKETTTEGVKEKAPKKTKKEA